MENIRLLILYRDQEYGFALARAISNLHKDFHVTVSSYGTFSNNAGIKKYDLALLEGAAADFPGMANDSVELMATVILMDERPGKDLQRQLEDVAEAVTKGPSGNKKTFCLYRYEKISQLMADLRYIYGQLTGKRNFIKDFMKTKIIGFYSASGGTGKSVVSMSVARDLSKYREKKVLYLNFDSISSDLLCLGGNAPKRSLGDYLYYLFHKEKGNLCSYMDSFIFSDEYGVHSFISATAVNELGQLKQEELSYFLDFLLVDGRYDYILLDMACTFHEETLFLLRSCNQLFFLEGSCPVSSYKSQRFREYFHRTREINGINSPLISVVNKGGFSESPEEDLYGEEREHSFITIQRDDSSFQYREGYLDIDINHLFGMGIKKIVDEIL